MSGGVALSSDTVATNAKMGKKTREHDNEDQQEAVKHKWLFILTQRITCAQLSMTWVLFDVTGIVTRRKQTYGQSKLLQCACFGSLFVSCLYLSVVLCLAQGHRAAPVHSAWLYSVSFPNDPLETGSQYPSSGIGNKSVRGYNVVATPLFLPVHRCLLRLYRMSGVSPRVSSVFSV